MIMMRGEHIFKIFSCSCHATGSAYSLITPVKQFITDHAHPVHDPQIAVPVVRDFLDSLKDRVAEHELWKVK